MRSLLPRRESRPEYPFEVVYSAIVGLETKPGSVVVPRAVDEHWAMQIALRLLEKKHGLRRRALTEHWLLEPKVVQKSTQAVFKLRPGRRDPQPRLAF